MLRQPHISDMNCSNNEVTNSTSNYHLTKTSQDTFLTKPNEIIGDIDKVIYSHATPYMQLLLNGHYIQDMKIVAK